MIMIIILKSNKDLHKKSSKTFHFFSIQELGRDGRTSWERELATTN